MTKKKRPHWRQEALKLKPHHGWRVTEGYELFVADRGAVRFHFPRGWVIVPDTDSIKLYDVEPPDDNCRLAFSYLRLPPIDWSKLPLSRLLREAVEHDKRPVITKGEVVEINRPDLEIAWTEFLFMDPNEHREAYARIALARGSNIQSLLTFDFWAADKERFAAAWDEVLRSIQQGRYVEDPTVGDIIH